MKLRWFILVPLVVSAALSIVAAFIFNSPWQWFAFNAATCALFVSGGVMLTGVSVFSRRKRRQWARRSLALAGVLIALVGAAELTRYLSLWTLPADFDRQRIHAVALIQGIALGLLIALKMSGEVDTRES